MIIYPMQIDDESGQRVKSPVNRENYKIYIVDDDESVRRALKRLFKSVGLGAETFASAVEFLITHHPVSHSCLVLDVKMPGLLGLELQEYLKAEKIEVPIIFISAYHDEEIRIRAIKAGARAFLFKPFNDQALLDEVYSSIGLQAPEDFKGNE